MKDIKNKGYSFRNYKSNQITTIVKVPPKKSPNQVAKGVGVVFGSVFLVMLIIILFRATGSIGNGDLTFTGFLNYLSTYSAPSVDLTIFNLNIVADWGLFNGLREFINSILGIFNFMLSLTQLVINALIFIFGFVRWLFVG